MAQIDRTPLPDRSYLVKLIVADVEAKNATTGKEVSFVLCTNLSTLSDEHLEF